MTQTAFNNHNAGCPNKGETYGDINECRSTWIGGKLEELFENTNYNIDAMFVQEIDWPMLQGLKGLKEGKKYNFVSITGQDIIKAHKKTLNQTNQTQILSWKEHPDEGNNFYKSSVEDFLKTSKAQETQTGTPAGDHTFVVWNKNRVKGVTCKQAGMDISSKTPNNKGEYDVYDMTKVGLCEISKNGFVYNVLGMHADGDNGFTVQAAKKIKATKAKPIDIAIGDINTHNPQEFWEALGELNKNLIIPRSDWKTGKKGLKSVYRVTHNHRKLVQAVQNNKIEQVVIDSLYDKKKTGKGKLAKFFTNLKKEDPAYFEMLVKKGGDTSWWENEYHNTLGLDKEFKAENVNNIKETHITSEVKREDWAAFDATKFEIDATVTIPYEQKLREISRYEVTKGVDQGSKKENYPIEGMESDHLPVIIELTHKQKETCTKDFKKCRENIDTLQIKKEKQTDSRAPWKPAWTTRSRAQVKSLRNKLGKFVKKVAARWGTDGTSN